MSDMNLQTTESVAARMSADVHDEARRYQRDKLKATLLGLAVNFIVLVFLAFALAPILDDVLRGVVGDSPWLRLFVFGGLTAAAFEIVSLPLDLWSGFILEHRYGL